MTDKEKIIKGLECCTQHGSMCGLDCNGHWGWTDDSHTGIELLGEYRTKCPYGDCKTGCVKTLAKDALALMKTQESRVMTIGDLYGNDMGYFERRDEELVWPVLICRGGPDSDGTVGLVRKDAFEIMADCGLINQTWRIWTAYPTKEQREAAKWE